MRSVFAALLACLGAASAAAQPAEPDSPRSGVGVLSFTFENDTFAGLDRYYTSGARIGWRSRNGAPAPLAAAGTWLGPWLLPRDAEVQWGVALGQWMYTSRAQNTHDPPRDDRPYAGQLAATLSLEAADDASAGIAELTLGVVGPWSFTDEIQQTVHEWTGADPPHGWGHQISNRPVAMLSLERRWRFEHRLREGLAIDVVPALGVHLGNVQTAAAAGTLLRFGHGLGMDFGPLRMRPALSGLGVFEPPAGLAGYLFVGVEGRALAYDVTLDGNHNGYWQVDREPFVGELPFGLALAWHDVRLSATGVLQSRTFDEQTDAHHAFGSLTLSFAF